MRPKLALERKPDSRGLLDKNYRAVWKFCEKLVVTPKSPCERSRFKSLLLLLSAAGIALALLAMVWPPPRPALPAYPVILAVPLI